ncbi:hypothetical protein LDENG_00083990 [Lucifuga dentata]|nr:hypothetical protein LDENG_00083990 [Lucifuga dentata]
MVSVSWRIWFTFVFVAVLGAFGKGQRFRTLVIGGFGPMNARGCDDVEGGRFLREGADVGGLQREGDLGCKRKLLQTERFSSSGINCTNSAEMDSGFKVKELNKRASGQAFEVILSPSTLKGRLESPLCSPMKRETSMEEIKRKLDAAEERRQKLEAEVLKQIAGKREHEKEVIQKAIEENSNFSKMTQEKHTQKMETNKENRRAQMVARSEKFKERDRKLEEVKKNKETTKERGI